MNKQYTSRIESILEFIKIAERLKTELRHSWTNDVNRQESVAEHTWMSSLLAVLLAPEIKIKVDVLKLIKMVIIHDLVETINGDIPAFEVSKRQDSKFEDEKRALEKLTSKLTNKKLAKEIMNLWLEFEEVKTNEAQMAMSIDKVEALIEHNISNMKTWSQGDYNLSLYAKDAYFNFDPFIREFKNAVDRWTVDKVRNEGDVNLFRKNEYDEFKKRQAS